MRIALVPIPPAWSPRNGRPRAKWARLWLTLVKAKEAGQAIQIQPMTAREANAAFGSLANRAKRHEGSGKVHVSGQHSGRPIFWIDGPRSKRRLSR